MQRAIPEKLTQTKRRQIEAAEQEALFQWRDLHINRYPNIDLMFAIPNGAYLQGDSRRRAMQWAKLKRQGAKKGVFDVFLPVPMPHPLGVFHGLWIEMKAPAPYRSEVSEDQEEWGRRMRNLGYLAYVCYGAADAIEVIKAYYAAGGIK